MSQTDSIKSRALILAVAGALMAGPAFADRPSWAGGGKKHEDSEGDYRKGKGRDRDDRSRHDNDRAEVRVQTYFGDRQKVVVRDYFGREYRGGNCPPGLAKKHNGCMPPGLAKKWRMGSPLPRDLDYYELPPALVVQIGRPPAGYRYVRVASDILLIAVGTGMVVDAIQDLGRM